MSPYHGERFFLGRALLASLALSEHPLQARDPPNQHDMITWRWSHARPLRWQAYLPYLLFFFQAKKKGGSVKQNFALESTMGAKRYWEIMSSIFRPSATVSQISLMEWNPPTPKLHVTKWAALWSHVCVVVMEAPLAGWPPSHVMDCLGARPLRWLSVLVEGSCVKDNTTTTAVWLRQTTRGLKTPNTNSLYKPLFLHEQSIQRLNCTHRDMYHTYTTWGKKKQTLGFVLFLTIKKRVSQWHAQLARIFAKARLK